MRSTRSLTRLALRTQNAGLRNRCVATTKTKAALVSRTGTAVGSRTVHMQRRCNAAQRTWRLQSACAFRLTKATPSAAPAVQNNTWNFIRRFCSAAASSTTVPLPPLGDSISEGTVVEIVKDVGEQVAVDDVLMIMETDKVSIDIRSPVAGVVQKYYAGVGDSIEVGASVADISTDESAVAADTSAAEPEPAKESKSETEASHTPSEFVIDLPPMGDSITEGTIGSLVKAVGDSVDIDEVLAVVETDKVSVDVRSPQAGVIVSFSVDVGDTLEVGKPLVTLKTSGAAPSRTSSKASSESAPAPSAATPSPTSSSSAQSHGRTPMIKFRHGKREQIDKCLFAASPAKSAPKAAPPAKGAPSVVNLSGVAKKEVPWGHTIAMPAPRLDSIPDLPERYRRQAYDDAAIELIQMGGAV